MTMQKIKEKRIFRHLFALSCLALTAILLTGAWLLATTPQETGASSHREAPLISGDPTVDNLDVYAFVSPDAQNTVSLISTWIPFEEPGGGPNFFHFDPGADYYIKIDSDGNAIPDVTYWWQFSPIRFDFPGSTGGNTFLHNTGPIGANYAADTDFNVRQYYTVTKITGDTKPVLTTTLYANKLMPPDNIGPRSTPNYAAIAANAVNVGSGPAAGYKEFTGQRDDPFFVDVRSIFDLLGLRSLNALHSTPLAVEPGQDVLEGFNAHATAIQVPISELVSATCNNTATNTNCVIGVWSTAERGGVQVSRQGNPLINEVVMSLALKDAFNSVPPSADQTIPAVVSRVLTSELASLMNVFYPALAPIDKTGRNDIAIIALAGIPTVNQQTNSAFPPAAGKVASEQLRLNTALKPTEAACQGDPLGLFNDPAAGPADAGDLTAFPNGRRLEDDVTDIALRVVGQGYGAFLAGTFGGAVPTIKNLSPNNILGDDVGENDEDCLPNFPYMGTPHSGYENNHGGLYGGFFPILQNN